MVGAEVEFNFSEEWSGLIKVAVFTAGDEKRCVAQQQWNGSICRIPHECLAEPDRHLLAGVYGISSDGSLVIPTVYADLGMIFTGADTEETPGTEFSPPLWAQVCSEIAVKADKADMVTEISAESTNSVYPSAKAVRDAIANALQAFACSIDVGQNPIKFGESGSIRALDTEEIQIRAETGEGVRIGDGVIRGIHNVEADYDAASKIYVDTAIRIAIAEALGTTGG